MHIMSVSKILLQSFRLTQKKVPDLKSQGRIIRGATLINPITIPQLKTAMRFSHF